MAYKIAVIPGDGIGPEVIREGIKVLKAVEKVVPNLNFEFVEYPFGWEHYKKTKELITESALEEISKMDAIYFGAVGHPDAPLGLLEQGILLKLRFHFDQYVNLRPVKLYSGVPCPLKDKTPKDIDFYVVRENTEDFYVGLSRRFKSFCKDALKLEREFYELKFGIEIKGNSDNDFAYQIGLISKSGAKRVMEYAFELCKRKKRKKVTCVDKANVLDIYNLWRETFTEVAKNYPNIQTEFALVDAIAMWFVKNPEWYDVVVTPNMFGDILTDLGAIIQGGMGLAHSGNINPKGVSMFEPIHGSAPKYASLNIANPIATILAGQMMLDHLGEERAARLIDKAVEEVLAEGKVRTKDLGGNSKTSEVGDAIAEKLKT